MRARKIRRDGYIIRLRLDHVKAVVAKHGARQMKDQAELFGLTESTYSRLVNERIDPGRDTIATLLTVRPDDPDFTWEALFEVVAA